MGSVFDQAADEMTNRPAQAQNVFDLAQSQNPQNSEKQFDLGATINSAGNAAKNFALGLPSGLAATADLALTPQRAAIQTAGNLGDATGRAINGFMGLHSVPSTPQLDRITPIYDAAVAPQIDNEDAYRFGRSIAPSFAGSALVPGASFPALAASGALGNVVTDAADQQAGTGTFDPQALLQSGVVGGIVGPASHYALGGLNRFLKGVRGRNIPEAKTNASTGQQTDSVGTAGSIVPSSFNAIDPALLEGDDLAAHQFLRGDVFDRAAISAKPRVRMSLEQAKHGQPLPPVATPGDFRFPTDRYGHDRVNSSDSIDLPQLQALLANHPNVDANKLGETVNKLAALKAKESYDSHALRDYASALHRQYSNGQEVVTHKGVKLTNKPELVIPKPVQGVIDKVADELSNGAKRKAARTVRGLIDAPFGNNPTDHKLFPEPIPTDKDAAFQRLVQLKDNHIGSVKRGNNGKGSRDIYDKLKNESKDLLESAEKAFREVTKDPFARLSIRTETAHPMGSQHGTVQATIEYTNEAVARSFEKNAKQRFQTWQNVFKSASIKNPRYTPNVNINASRAALGFGAGLLALDQPAKAADGSEEHEDHTLQNIGMGLIGLAAFHRFGPAAMEAFLKNEKLFRASSFFKDTLDQIDYLDNALGKRGNGLGKEILQHQAAALQSQFGIKFGKQEEKAIAYESLKNKELTPVEALQGLAGSAFEHMTQPQRDAVVNFHLNRQTLVAKVRAYRKEVGNAVNGGVLNKDHGLTRHALDALTYLENALSPRRAPQTDIDRMIQGGLSHAMDSFFFLNPKFHLLNLSDMLISGASRVGIANIVKANALLATDKELSQAFQHSNLTGSFRAERDAQAAAAGAKKKGFGFNLPDLPSDRVNADRVTLAAFLDYVDRNPQKVQAMGYKSATTFVKDMLAGNVDPTVAMDCWSHAAEVGSRTLGIDPFRLNTDYLSRSASSPAFGVFVRQPARIARLVMHNIANKNMGGLYTMLAATALLGGRAAIPLEVRRLWSTVDPDSAYQTEKALDQINIYRDITGQDSADKLDWSIAYPIQAATNPAVELARQIPNAASDLYHAAYALKDVEDWSEVLQDEHLLNAAQRLFSLGSTIAKPKIAGAPVKQALAVMKSGKEIINNRSSVSYFNPTTGHGFRKKDELDHEEFNIGPSDVIKDFLLPGKRAYESALLQAANEEADKKRLGKDTSQSAYDRERILQNMRSGRPVLE